MSCPLQYYHIAVPSLCWNDTETDDKQREPMFNIWFTCYISLSANSSFISKEKEINIKVWQSLNQNYGSSFKYQHLLSPDSTLALKWWERRGPLTTMSGLGNGWFSADNYCRLGGRTGKRGRRGISLGVHAALNGSLSSNNPTLISCFNWFSELLEWADTTRAPAWFFLTCSQTTQSII